jgi:hypothetical protein
MSKKTKIDQSKDPMPSMAGAAMQSWVHRNARFSERVLPGGKRVIRNDAKTITKETVNG